MRFAASLLAIIALSWPTWTSADGGTATEVSAGGLSFAANPSIRLEQQDVVVAPDRVSVTYALHNEAADAQSIFISFLLPDLEAMAVADGEVTLPATDAANYVQFAISVDGQPITPQIEQRALALGLNASPALASAGLDPFPNIDQMFAQIAALSPTQRSDLAERGVLREEGATLVPAWSVKTVAYWKQALPPGKTITIRHSYRPISGRSNVSPEALATYRKRVCLTPAQESAIAKLGSGSAAVVTTVTFATTANADALGPARRFRLIVEPADGASVVASCKEGLRQTGPAQFDWSAADYVPDEDFQFLFAR